MSAGEWPKGQRGGEPLFNPRATGYPLIYDEVTGKIH
jgi:hypothetical protein